MLPLAVVTLGAATVHGVAGFGFGLIALPAFMWLLGSRDAVPLVIIVNLMISALLVVRLRGAVNRPLLLRFCAGGIVGLPPGLMLFWRANVDQLMIAAGLAVVAFVGVVAARGSAEVGAGDPDSRSASVTGVGALAGVMAIALGMPGPPITLYLTVLGVGKDALRATALAFFVASYAAALLLQSITIGVEHEVWRSAALLLPAAGVGGLIGDRLCRYVDEAVFRRGVLALLVVIGGSALIRGLVR